MIVEHLEAPKMLVLDIDGGGVKPKSNWVLDL